MENKQNYFQILNKIDVSDKISKKNGLNYLSWSWAWGELKKIHPNATSKVYETETGCIYHTDGRTAWVKTGVTVNGIEHIEYLPIMDFKNKSMKLELITSVDVNKTIQRSITKAISRHGIGAYIYAGEDLPEEDTLSQAQVEELKSLLVILGNNTEQKLLDAMHVKSVYGLKEGQFESLKKSLQKRVEMKKE